MSEATGGNAEQKEYWDGAAGDTWVAAQEQLDAIQAELDRSSRCPLLL